MRIRNVKPEFYRSDDIDALTWEQRYFFIALFSYVDDNGVGRDRESDICADLFAGDFSGEPTETLRKVRDCLLALVRRGLVVRYEAEGKRYLFITGWDAHQYVKNPNRERYPRPDKALLQSSVDPGETQGRESVDITPDLPPVVGSGLLVVGSRSLVVGSENARSATRGTRLPEDWMPDQELIAQMRSECPDVDLAQAHRVFTDYWRAQPGQKGVKTDWPATWRNWIRRDSNGATKVRTVEQRATQQVVTEAMRRAMERDAQREAEA